VTPLKLRVILVICGSTVAVLESQRRKPNPLRNTSAQTAAGSLQVSSPSFFFSLFTGLLYELDFFLSQNLTGARPKRILLVIKPQSPRKAAGKSVNRAVEFRTDQTREDSVIAAANDSNSGSDGEHEHEDGERERDVTTRRAKRRTRSRKRKVREDDEGDDGEWTEGTSATAAATTAVKGIIRGGSWSHSEETAELEDLWVSEEEEVLEVETVPRPVAVLSPESYSRIKISLAGGTRMHEGRRGGEEASPRKSRMRTRSQAGVSQHTTSSSATVRTASEAAQNSSDNKKEHLSHDEDLDDTEREPSFFGLLNTDCLILVFSYLETADLCRSARVSRHWHNVAHSRPLVTASSLRKGACCV